MASTNKPLKTCVMAFLSHTDTYSSGDFQPYANLFLGISAGAGYEVYRDALVRRGYNVGRICTIANGTNTITSNAHGFTDGMPVRHYTGNAGGPPGNITVGTTYFVRDATANTFKISLTAGGGEHDIMSDGTAPIAFAQVGSFNGCVVFVPGSGSVYPQLQMYGEAVLDFYSLFDLAFVGHAPHKNVFKEIKIRSRRPKGTKTGIFFFNTESVGQGGNQNSWFNAFDSSLLPVALSGNIHGVVPTAGGTWPAPCNGVDQFETCSTCPNGSNSYAATCKSNNAGAGAASTHTWLIDLAGSPEVDGWPELVRAAIAARYDSGDIDCILIDNVNPTRNVFLATNYNAGNDASYFGGQANMMQRVQNVIGRGLGLTCGGNGSGHGEFFSGNRFMSENKNPLRYQEHFFCLNGTQSGTPEPFETIKSHLLKQHAAFKYTNILSIGRNSGNATSYNGGSRNLVDRWFHNNNSDAGLYNRGPGVSAGVDYGDWPRLGQFLRQNGLWDSVYIVAARGSSVFGVAYDPEFGPIV